MHNLLNLEVFKPVVLTGECRAVKKALSGMYLISDKGRVKRVADGKIMPSYLNTQGYPNIGLIGKDGRLYSCYIHHLVADAFLYNPDRQKYTCINHIDENKANNDVVNLEWCTQSYNSKYSAIHKVPLTVAEILTISSVFDMCDAIDLLPDSIQTRLDMICFKLTAEFMEKYPELLLGKDYFVDYFANRFNVSKATIKKVMNNEGFYGYVIATYYERVFRQDKDSSELNAIIYESHVKSSADVLNYFSGVVKQKRLY